MTLQRVTVRDFQSLADVDLELGQVTVIVGATNAGKSGFVRALQAALFNWSGGEFVRRDCLKASVALDFGGAGLRWVKPRKGGGEYTIWRGDESTRVTRAGREAVPLIEEITGVREIETDGVKARLQVDGQFDEPFLLSHTGGQAAKLLAHVSKLDVLVKAQVRARQDFARARRRAEEAEKRAEGLAAQLEAMPDYEGLLRRAEGLQARLQELAERSERAASALALHRAVKQSAELAEGWVVRRPDRRLEEARIGFDRLTKAGALTGDLKVAEEQSRDPQLGVVQDGVAQMEGELAGLLKELRICPVCRRPM